MRDIVQPCDPLERNRQTGRWTVRFDHDDKRTTKYTIKNEYGGHNVGALLGPRSKDMRKFQRVGEERLLQGCPVSQGDRRLYGTRRRPDWNGEGRYEYLWTQIVS